MKLIVGLGNPGKKYERTRHNAGFRAVLKFHEMSSESFSGWSKKFNAEVAEGRVGEEKVVLMMPQTFMNLSGNSVAEAAQFWKIDPSDIVVVYDDVAIDLGSVRIRSEGSAGGHNGMKSMIERLGTQEFSRIRIGVGTERLEQVPLDAFVLEQFSEEEEKLLAIEKAANAIDSIVREGLAEAQNKFGE